MKLVCVGDSITRGQVSVDYVAMLRDRLDGTEVVNAGVNYDVSAHLLTRLDDVIDQDPDLITVLIGTNDARATLSEGTARSLRDQWKLGEDFSRDTYAANLAAIAGRLEKETHARVALLSIPVLGEELGSVPLRRAGEYSETVRKVAAETYVSYLPVYERMTGDLEEHGRGPGGRYRAGNWFARRGAIQHFILRRGFDAISAGRGLRLTTDTVHLNSRGAGIIADLIEDFTLGR
jgi:lysophospholipase L1-like esterase